MALTIDGSDPTGDLGDLLDAKLPIAGGKILQVVRATDASTRSTTSATFVDVTGVSVTITPQKSDSAIIVIGTVLGETNTSSGSSRAEFRLTDNSGNPLSGAQLGRFSAGTQTVVDCPITLIGYSTPATISATTYKMQFKKGSGTLTVYAVGDSQATQMYAIEVSA
jgi:hypothetical protein